MIIRIYIFLMGMCIGSFLNLVIYRIINSESIVFPRSHCDYCGKTLKFYDLIPLISFISTNGKCRYCNKKLSIWYPLSEFLIGVVFFIYFYNLEFNLNKILILLAILNTFVISVIDIKTFDIYMKLILINALLSIIFILNNRIFDFDFLKFILIFSIIFLIIYYLSGKNIGDGDYYLFLSLFAFVNSKNLLLFVFVAIWIGAFLGLIIAILKKSFKIKIPFAIFILISFIYILRRN
ncbi:MAG: prepilin peptidase [Peptoniphilaceae bacterium]|nr:prepilin peptidase [Peptoniphilaceae bacterium]MDD7382831.1 prepilin peptidase [Peptoniphilaceae bacterium]MDY3738210.1 prepilin peptidase [Peptoniphilaceae bacterium]